MAPGSTRGLGQWPSPPHSLPCLPHRQHTGYPWHDLAYIGIPLINWQQGLVTFPEQVQIASEEEADPDPLAKLPTQEYDISIDLLPDAKLSPGPIYGMTDAESRALKQHIDKELATGKIRPSTSSAGAPVMFVKKADGSLRLVVDYRKLNEVTHKNVYPLPRQDDLMAKLRNAKLFTKLDLRWGYNNVRIKEGDDHAFGLTNAPAAFQHFMNDLFRDLIDITVVIYLDDILIFSEDPKKHPEHVREVLSRLMKNQLFCKLSKCHFHVTTVDYLGIVISLAGFSMDQKKIEAVTSWPQPKTVKQFRSLSLHNLTRKETPWSWGTQEEEAFQELKSLVTRSPVLIHSNPDLPYYLETDASGVAMGAILSQQGEDNRLHPIAYMSKRADYVEFTQEPEVMLPAEVFANTSKEELEIVTEIRSRLKEDPSIEPIIQFLTEDAENAPPAITEGIPQLPLAGHPGQQRTLELLSRNYWWPGMKSSAKEWVECCPTCQANRRAHNPVIALKPLEVPPFPFHTISYDFITGFPKSEGHDAILVVIDLFSKLGHFIPTSKKVSAKGLANLFVSHIWKLHGLPVKTISDRGTTFTGKFLRALYQQLGIKPSFSLAYHPESDRQTERVNQFIEFYLRSYVTADHSDWVKWLPLAEYAYNNAKHSATGKTPFEIDLWQKPNHESVKHPCKRPEADLVADTLAREWKEAKAALRMSKERMTRDKGTVPEYSIGEKVWLDGKNVELRTNSNKLDPKQLGPFEGTHIPKSTISRKTPPETIEGEEEYEVEQIIDSKRQRGKWFYLIKWKGYGPEDNSWEPEELLEHSQEEIQRFNKSRLKKACDSAKSL
ncbi:Chromo (CHRromatin Organization MOdifier) domain [Rhizoctonia solani]|uniref:Chromo (CHRromatin Organization MOdifier) domain n=1 Tax=Rhizoctonia solani TaxID=456999 RepID=A0A8H7I415_9AGAM|nr:Chromo (CHRromatin Organization MOdifier) domain [Rhizoctonia solani]